MLQSITNILQSASMGPAALPLAFLLGLAALKWLPLKLPQFIQKRETRAARGKMGVAFVGFYLLATFQ